MVGRPNQSKKNILFQTTTDICRRGRHVESLQTNLVSSLVGDVTYITRHEAGNLTVFSLRFFYIRFESPEISVRSNIVLTYSL